MTNERRHSARHAARLDAEVEYAGNSFGSSLTRDASETGLLVVTAANARVGDIVTIRCSLGETVLSVTGKVTRRSEASDDGLSEIAVLLSSKNPLVAEIFRQLERSNSAPPSAPPSAPRSR
jgi:hypothetical protein